MFDSILLVIIAILLLVSIVALRQYKAHYGYSFWYDFSQNTESYEKISLVHIPFEQLYLSQNHKKNLASLHHLGCRRFLTFRVGTLEKTYLIITENTEKKIWITMVITGETSYCAATVTYLKDNKERVITISNAPHYKNKIDTKYSRTNYKGLEMSKLFERLERRLPEKRRHQLSLRSYVSLSKILFLDELIDLQRSNIQQQQLDVPVSLMRPHGKLINKFAKANNISPHFLEKNSHKILMVNNEASPDYLVANIVTASKDLYNSRKMIQANLIANNDSNQWFKDMNDDISEANKFRYLGTLDENGLVTDFYYHEYITLRFKQGNVHRI